MENGAKKQEFFNCLLFPFFHVLSRFFQARFQNAFFSFFPTCQVRVVRFYQNCSSPSPSSPPPSMFTSALPTLRQALGQLPHAVGTAGP